MKALTCGDMCTQLDSNPIWRLLLVTSIDWIFLRSDPIWRLLLAVSCLHSLTVTLFEGSYLLLLLIGPPPHSCSNFIRRLLLGMHYVRSLTVTLFEGSYLHWTFRISHTAFPHNLAYCGCLWIVIRLFLKGFSNFVGFGFNESSSAEMGVTGIHRLLRFWLLR